MMHQSEDKAPTPVQVLRELWRRIQDTNDPEISIKLINEAAKWVDIVEAERVARKSGVDRAE